MKKKFIFTFVVTMGIVSLSSCVSSNKVTAISFKKDSYAVVLDESLDLTNEIEVLPKNAKNYELTWASEKKDVATVLGGTVYGNELGKTQIRVGIKDTLIYAYCTVDVEETERVPATSIKIDQANNFVAYINEDRTLSATLSPKNAFSETLTWSSDDASIASINATTGVLRGIKDGTTKIRVTSENGLSDAIDVISRARNDGEHTINTDSNGNYLFDFYSINDLHGSLEYLPATYEPGITRLATAIKTNMNNNPDGSIIIAGGDMWQGSADSNLTKGRLVTSVMNELNFTSMTLGNHEFDWTENDILVNKELAEFPFLACNIYDKRTSTYSTALSDPYTIVTNEATGIKIGIIGAIGEGITNSIVASNVKNYEFHNPTSLVASYANTLRNQKDCDIVIFSYHYGSVDETIAQYVDAVFLAHSHQEMRETITSGGRTVPVIQSASNSKLLGNIQLAVHPSTHEVVETKKYQNIDVLAGNYAEDSATQAIYDQYYENEIKAIKEEVLYTSSSRVTTSVILQFTLKYMLQKYSLIDPLCIAANHNDGGVRSTIAAGVITYGDVYKALPFDNNLYLVDFGNNQTGLNYITQYYTTIYADGYNKSFLASGDGFKMITISYCFEKLSNYESYDYEILADYPRDIVADAIRAGARFDEFMG